MRFNGLLESGGLTYASIGVDRRRRTRSRERALQIIQSRLSRRFGPRLVELPFGFLVPAEAQRGLFYDLQLEGVGTKTLVAEFVADYCSIGVDAVAMAVNDIIRSGARPLLISDSIHVARSEDRVVSAILDGVSQGADLAGCSLVSGETGDVPEILHDPFGDRDSLPFDLMVSCFGIVEKGDIIDGIVAPGDAVIGIRSSGLHSNGISLARRILLKKWGGRFEPGEVNNATGRPVIEDLLEPTIIYARAINDLRKRLRVKAAVHITGDGFQKFRRLMTFQQKRRRASVGFDLELQNILPIFRSIIDSARWLGRTINMREMFRTFNMGYGFAIVVGDGDCSRALQIVRRHHASEVIGKADSSNRLRIVSPVGDINL